MFLDQLIGIAKTGWFRAPSHGPKKPNRSPTSSSILPFVKEASAISRDVICYSPLSLGEQDAALSTLKARSDEALINILLRLRGRIGTYSNPLLISADPNGANFAEFIQTKPA